MPLFEDLNNLMVRHRFRPNRKLAQNFVVDEKLIGRMVAEAELSPDDTVLEIGAGAGFLTQELLKKCRVVAVELDAKLCGVLREKFGEQKNFTLVEGDFLGAELPKFSKIVALPPYTISSGLVRKLIGMDFELAVLVFQREFARRLVAEPGFMEYSAISVLANYFFEPEILVERIPPASFFPKPNSFSSLIKLKRKKRFGSALDEELFIKFVRSVFRYRNKNLRNALEKACPFLAADMKLDMQKFARISESCRPGTGKISQLPVGEFVRVFNSLLQRQPANSRRHPNPKQSP